MSTSARAQIATKLQETALPEQRWCRHQWGTQGGKHHLSGTTKRCHKPAMSAALPSSRPLGAPLRATDDLEIDEGDLWDDGDMPQASADRGADPALVTPPGMRSSQRYPVIGASQEC